MVGRNLCQNLKTLYEIYTPNSQELDLMQKNDCSDYIGTVNPDLIIHAAGYVGGIQENLLRPDHFLYENMIMGFNLIKSAYECGVASFINLGSTCMYPKDIDSQLTEDMILSGRLEPTNEGYALAKIATAKFCQYINNKEKSFNYKTIIPCNLYGPYDKFDPARSHLIPSIIHKLHMAKIRKDDSVLIWGSGTARREFMHVDDLVSFIKMAITGLDRMPELVNVGLGIDYSVYDYYEFAKEIIGFNGIFKFDYTKPEGMKMKLSSTYRAQEFGWTPNIDIHNGISKTYEFYKGVINE